MKEQGITSSSQSLGVLLREWRLQRKISQLDLALQLHISSRHLSYIETDKAQPSENLLYGMLRALNIPQSERNTILMSAGFRPRQLTAVEPGGRSVSEVLDRYLKQFDHTPVLVKDAIWDIVHANALAVRVFSELLGMDISQAPRPFNVLELVFSPKLLRSKILNWDEVAQALISHVRHETGFAAEHAAFQEVLSEVSSCPGFMEMWEAAPVGTSIPESTLYRLEHDGRVLNFEAVLMSMGTPYDAVLRGVRLDNFLPADDETRQYIQALSAAAQ